MADTKTTVSALTDNDWQAIAIWIKDEQTRRKVDRADREKLWKGIDRQIAMEPVPRDPRDSTKSDWYPAIEMPLQYNALEVIQADVRRLLFPRTGTWFNVRADISQEYEDRFTKRRMAGVNFGMPQLDQFTQQMGVTNGTPAPMTSAEPVPVRLDQETADVLIKATLEHFHRFYDFRSTMGLFTNEQIKYGTGVCRVRDVRTATYSHEYRGIRATEVRGPAVIPCSIWNTYLDDSWTALLHEGEFVGPSIIEYAWQPLVDVQQAAKVGGPGKGWIASQVKKLVGLVSTPDKKPESVELLRFEGDVLVPRSRAKDSIWLPNVRLTVAIGQKSQGVVRYEENPMPFRSYVIGHYFRHDVRKAYGDSPLMKGHPLQELATEAANDLAAACRLDTFRPVSYDRNDATFAGAGGPIIAPNALWGSDSPDSIQAHEVANPQAMLMVYQANVKQYEDTTGVNDARRGESLRSHTTAEAAQIEASQGISRTDDFVTDLLAGPMTTILHMEFEIIKKIMAKPQDVSVGQEGIDGWISIAAADLADRCEFEPVGAEGQNEDKQRAVIFAQANAQAIQISAACQQQTGTPVPLHFEAMITETYDRSGITNASKYVGAGPAISGMAATAAAVPGLVATNPALSGAPLASLPPAGAAE